MPRTVEDLVAEARSKIREISLEDLVDMLAGDLVLVDVLEFQIHAHPAMACVADAALADPSRRMVLYCRTGGRSALAADSLRQLGFTDVCSLAGGFEAWRNADLSVSME